MASEHPISTREGNADAPPRPPERNLPRERMQAELRYLRELAVTLESELKALKEQVACEDDDGEDTPGAKAYEQQAIEEFIKRTEAEAENKQLKQSVEQQLRVIQCFKELLRQHIELGAVTLNTDLAGRNSLKRFHNQFLDEIDTAYLLTDLVIDLSEWEGSMVDLGCVTELKRRQFGDDQETYLEIRQQRSVDIDYSMMCDATWNIVIRFFHSPQVRLVESYFTNERMVVQFHRANEYRGQITEICVTFVIRRFVEHDRDVRVWRTILSSAADDANGTLGAYMDETGWGTFERKSRLGPGGEEIRSTRSRICSQIVPRWEESNDLASPSAGDLTNILVLLAKDDVDAVIDILLQMSLAKTSPTRGGWIV
ncbi:hypothetical protein Poli38472_004941 [Pythium oligandrum]|uniref:Uncharacterized protein n=1 Tax=Pythium oligandrum TaxID=41045 RepID=A0A8K1CB06_PYTOL|nr:hypothetical protein Poli38472_004941 [Pythium oligandrum]|eukprot:TMW59872.1 hypothetical protein Poli38472_004941 [Pythium oligandrum]